MSICDLRTGVCGDLNEAAEERLSLPATPKATILYVTDPICSHCWAMEPAWRKLLFHYGAHVSYRHIYGGLLPNWNGFADAANGIREPRDIAPHWAEVAEHYGQPIDPSVWLNDPLDSSYPASIAVHAVRTLAPDLEEHYLRRIRQALFLEARNIARADVLTACAADVGLSSTVFGEMLNEGTGKAGFQRDMAEARQRQIYGFPTIIMINEAGEGLLLRGGQPYARLEAALLQVAGLEQATRTPAVAEVLSAYGSGTTKEFAEVLEKDLTTTRALLQAEGAKARALAGDLLWSSL
jgi:putative protein-disulfide isomerase